MTGEMKQNAMKNIIITYICIISVNENACKDTCARVIYVMNGVIHQNDETYTTMTVMTNDNKIFTNRWRSSLK
ncbi:hypothetical protein HMPREF2111_01429 [Staphylococcus aureus 917]|nr:hypothetical protein HMPREF9528_02428 [Staphylococcus aureus subsp. aureus MRSA131]EFW34693.1 hypothetical protein HMPREF9529_01667 [Staphylococcus aureus subsp. aureus MRSA177]KAJ47734.1 hypothetical protein HMPREF1625_00967 [Staphylococcus aureus 880]KIE15356.1 hypothetical protein HMPREF2111_01429 [Staphylococcus aureus 917]KXA32883.1 hypothetical protein HMPREF3211_02473 [Staphylococcus aureus]